MRTSAWEQRKVGDVVGKTFGGGTPATNIDAYWSGSIPWIQSSNLNENSFVATINKYISDSGITHSAAQLIPGSTIAVVTHVGVGKLAIMPDEYAVSQDFISLGDLNADIVFYAYSLHKRLNEDAFMVQGSAIKGITKETLLGKVIPLPSLREQAKIGALFSKLDSLITLHQCKAEALVSIKRLLLDRMIL